MLSCRSSRADRSVFFSYSQQAPMLMSSQMYKACSQNYHWNPLWDFCLLGQKFTWKNTAICNEIISRD